MAEAQRLICSERQPLGQYIIKHQNDFIDVKADLPEEDESRIQLQLPSFDTLIL